MHMEALDRSFSTASQPDVGGVLSLSSFPLTPDVQLNSLHEYSNDCLQSQYNTIQYADDNHYNQYGSNVSFGPSSPISTPTPADTTPIHSSSSSYKHTSRTPLSSISSYSSDTSSDPMLSSSQSSGLSDMPSISNMSISSDTSSLSSLFSSDSSNLCNPFSVSSNTTDNNGGSNTNSTSHGTGASNKVARSRKLNNASQLTRSSINDTGVPRRSSAPARDTTLCPPSNNDHKSFSNNTINKAALTIPSASYRKDSFVYDVQLESDNVLLFVPDLDLVKSHLMFAVREEVDVLKERIGELMERINHLEYENTILRKYATQEAIQQLQHHAPNP